MKYRKNSGLFRIILWEFDKNGGIAPWKADPDGVIPDKPNAEYLRKVGKIIKELSKKNISNLYKRRHEEGSKSIKHFQPGRELFLWAVLTGMDRKTKLMIWKHLEKDHVVSAAIASTMMKSMAELLNRRSFTLPPESNPRKDQSNPFVNSSDMKDDSESYGGNLPNIYRTAADLISEAKEYDELSNGVLKVCNDIHSSHLSYLLVRELPDWSNKSLLQIRYKGAKLHLSDLDQQLLHLARKRMKAIWYNNIDTDVSFYRIVLCIRFPILIFFNCIIKFNGLYTHNGKRKENTFEYMLEKYFQKTLKDSQEIQNDSQNKGNFVHKICHKYFQFYFAPVVKCYMHTMSYIAYLILFSIFLVTDFKTDQIGICEKFVWTWAATMFLDEIRQFFQSTRFKHKFSRYFDEKWNQYDIVGYVFLLTASVLRGISYSTRCPQCYEAARIIYAITLVMQMLRILQYFYISQKFGPHVVMIFTLLKDLPFFFFVFAVFMFAYGIFSQALLQPNSPLSWMTLYEITFTPYNVIYGQFADLDTQLREICGNSTDTSSPDGTSCADAVIMVFAFSAYSLFAIILLINLLIAIMNSRYDKEIEGTTTAKWLLNRHVVVDEYIQKSWLVPPLIILSHMAVFILYLRKKYRNNESNINNSSGNLNNYNLDLIEKNAVKKNIATI